MKSRSIRRSLLLRCGLGVGVALCLLSAGIYFLVQRSLYSELDDSLDDAAALMGNQIELENGVVIHEWLEGLGTNRLVDDDTLIEFWDESTGAATRSPNLQSQDLPRFAGNNGAPVWQTLVLANGTHARALGVRVFPFVLPEEVARMHERGQSINPKSLPHILVIARDLEPALKTLQRLRWILAGGTLLTLGLGFVMINGAVSVSLKPLEELSNEVRERSEHQLGQALQVPRELPCELTDLAREFDTLLARVGAIRQRERDFIRHAAHELRTPIAGLGATIDLALSQSRDAASYERALAQCREGTTQLGELVKRLSALARIGQAGDTSSRQTLDLAALSEECMVPFHDRAANLNLSLTSTWSQQPLPARGDNAWIRIILNNLFDNALSYSSGGSSIEIEGHIANDRARLSVSNTADDLPEDLERLFEPLFRRDPSRHDSTDHLGIGLTLSRDAAMAMGGTLQANAERGRITFVLDLPGV